jgi:hypothetical protein
MDGKHLFTPGKGLLALYHTSEIYDRPIGGIGFLEDGTPVKFCPDWCSGTLKYCSFSILRIRQEDVDKYIALLSEEARSAYEFYDSLEGEPLFVLIGQDPTEEVDVAVEMTPDLYRKYREFISEVKFRDFDLFDNFFKPG